MNKIDYLLTVLMEECCEVGQRCSKALRFGLTEMQPGQQLNNAKRLTMEFADLVATYETLIKEGAVKSVTCAQRNAKKRKLEKYMRYSRKLGILTK